MQTTHSILIDSLFGETAKIAKTMKKKSKLKDYSMFDTDSPSFLMPHQIANAAFST